MDLCRSGSLCRRSWWRWWCFSPRARCKRMRVFSSSHHRACECSRFERDASLRIKRNQDSKRGPSREARQWADKIHWRFLVWRGIQRPENGQRRGLRHVCHDRLPPQPSLRLDCAGGERANHRSVVVRITDRGDLVEEGRVIDLSYGAAEKLGMTWGGLAKVDLQVLSLGKKQ